jgi:hypothetical protein
MSYQARPDGLVNDSIRGERPPAPIGGTPLRTYDDWPVAASGLPIRTTCPTPGTEQERRPAPRPPAPEASGADRLRAFTDVVLEMHRVLVDRFIPMCSCGNPARHCPIVRAEHEVLGIPMPFTFDSPRLPYHEV